MDELLGVTPLSVFMSNPVKKTLEDRDLQEGGERGTPGELALHLSGQGGWTLGLHHLGQELPQRLSSPLLAPTGDHLLKILGVACPKGGLPEKVIHGAPKVLQPAPPLL